GGGQGRDWEGGAVPAVDHDGLPVEPATAQSGREVGDVVGVGTQAVTRDPDVGSLGPALGAGPSGEALTAVDEPPQLRLDAPLGLVGDLAPTSREQLHAG